jgi:isopentenyl-diphosphate delta-isomerase
MSDIQLRKKQHIQLAMDPDSQGKGGFGDRYLLPYKVLPEIELGQVDASIELLGKKVSQPLIIASMTGGSEYAEKINTNLARVAGEKKVAMGVGSQRVALEKDEAKRTFELVRKLNPQGVVFANMGAVQLNYGHGVESYRRVVEMVEADALYLHINPMQEALQPGGDVNWSGLFEKIEGLVKRIGIPVWVKEVGNGLDLGTALKLAEVGVKGVDVAGVGGTSWTWIEGKRAGNPRLMEWFGDFGWPTELLVEQMGKSRKLSNVSLVASGGIRNPIQGLKAGMMGASYYSSARPFLEAALESEAETRLVVEDWERGLKIAMFGMGCRTWEEAKKAKLVRVEKDLLLLIRPRE